MTDRTLVAAALALPLTLAAGCKQRDVSSGPALPPGAIAITVDGAHAGFEPSSVTVPPGRPVTMVFTRTSDHGCGGTLVFPELNIRRELPLNQPVTVAFNAPASGRVAFTCGMNMYRGAVVVQ